MEHRENCLEPLCHSQASFVNEVSGNTRLFTCNYFFAKTHIFIINKKKTNLKGSFICNLEFLPLVNLVITLGHARLHALYKKDLDFSTGNNMFGK